MKLSQIFISLCIASSTYAFDVDPVGKQVEEGLKHYQNKRYKRALEEFKKVEKEISEEKRASFNRGAAEYRAGDYDSAIKSFEKSARAKNPSLRTRSLYNLGNSYYEKGDKINAINSYLKALEVDPNFVPAKKNIELLQKQEEEKKQEKQQENSEKEENKSQKKEQNKTQESKEKKEAKKSEGDEEKEKKPSEGEKEENKSKLTREEAERILESSRQNSINKRKDSLRKRNKSGVFW